MINTKGYFYSDHHNVEYFTMKFAKNSPITPLKNDRKCNDSFDQTISGIKMNVRGRYSFHATAKLKQKNQTSKQFYNFRSYASYALPSSKNQITFQTLKKALTQSQNTYRRNSNKKGYKSNVSAALAVNSKQKSYSLIKNQRYNSRTRCFSAKNSQKQNFKSEMDSTKHIKINNISKDSFDQQTPSRQIKTSYGHLRSQSNIKSISTNHYSRFQDSAVLNQSQQKISKQIAEQPCYIEEKDLQVSMVSAFIPASKLKKRQKQASLFYNFLH